MAIDFSQNVNFYLGKIRMRVAAVAFGVTQRP